MKWQGVQDESCLCCYYLGKLHILNVNLLPDG